MDEAVAQRRCIARVPCGPWTDQNCPLSYLREPHDAESRNGAYLQTTQCSDGGLNRGETSEALCVEEGFELRLETRNLTQHRILKLSSNDLSGSLLRCRDKACLKNQHT